MQIDAGTKIVGLIGHPLSHSFSPFIHNKAFEILNLNYRYLAFDVLPENLEDAINGIKALGIIGVNVTIPHKEAVISHLDNIAPEARSIGAVNTIVNTDGVLTGYNTDVFGFSEALKKYKSEVVNTQVVIIGAGGAAKAVIYALITNFQPEKIIIVNRNTSRAELLVKHFVQFTQYDNFSVKPLFTPDITAEIKSSKLIVNATPIGMFPKTDETPIPDKSLLHSGQIVYDLVYNPRETMLLKMAKQKGAKVINGLDMLIFQAAKSFELWTGKEMPVKEIKKDLLQKVKRKGK